MVALQEVQDENGAELLLRVSMNFYRDLDDAYTVQSHPFTTDIDAALAADDQLYSVAPDATAAAIIQAFSADVDAMVALWRSNLLAPHLTLNPMDTERHTHHLVKAVVSRQSKAVGKKIPDIVEPPQGCQYKFVALSRDGEPVPGPLDEATIEAFARTVSTAGYRLVHFRTGKRAASFVK